MDSLGMWLLAGLVAFAVLLVITLGIAAFVASGREIQGGPPRGSLRRDEDEELPR